MLHSRHMRDSFAVLFWERNILTLTIVGALTFNASLKNLFSQRLNRQFPPVIFLYRGIDENIFLLRMKSGGEFVCNWINDFRIFLTINNNAMLRCIHLCQFHERLFFSPLFSH